MGINAYATVEMFPSDSRGAESRNKTPRAKANYAIALVTTDLWQGPGP